MKEAWVAEIRKLLVEQLNNAKGELFQDLSVLLNYNFICERFLVWKIYICEQDLLTDIYKERFPLGIFARCQSLMYSTAALYCKTLK